MQRLSAGDDPALNGLMERWQAPLTAFIYRYTGSHEDALDLAQETFVRVYQSRFRYRSGARFSAWLFTIAANLCRNHARWCKRHPTVSLHVSPGEDEIGADMAAPGLSPAASAERRELAEAVREQVQRLPHDLRTAVLLSEYEQLSHAEIAEILGCTPKAVETRLYRARERLRKSLTARSIGEADARVALPPQPLAWRDLAAGD